MARAQAELLPYKKQLLGALTTAMQEGGPEAAIDVCRLRAPEIAAAVAPSGVEIGRTSHRLRNPANAPAPWMEEHLEWYAAHPEDTAPRAVRLGSDHIGYVEPIHVKTPCLACHGEAIAPSVEGRVQALYPEDAATGFRRNDFRGLFWVKMPARSPA